jgi:hypothetical protein
MSEYLSRCLRCQGPNPALNNIYCASCRQIEAIEKQAERADSIARSQAETANRIAREQAYQQEQMNYAQFEQSNRNAELAREQATKNAKLVAEGKVSYDDAYKYGLHYIQGNVATIYCPIRGEAKPVVELIIDENGEFLCRRDVLSWSPFESEHLVHAFDCGLADYIKQLNLVGPGYDYMLQRAYDAGYNFETEFQVAQTVNIFGKQQEIKSRVFKTKIEQRINSSGYVEKFNPNSTVWKHGIKMFWDDKLNKAYIDGADAKLTELNSQEEVARRFASAQSNRIDAEQKRLEKIKLREAWEHRNKIYTDSCSSSIATSSISGVALEKSSVERIRTIIWTLVSVVLLVATYCMFASDEPIYGNFVIATLAGFSSLAAIAQYNRMKDFDDKQSSC